jgi:hypothetical protein
MSLQLFVQLLYFLINRAAPLVELRGEARQPRLGHETQSSGEQAGEIGDRWYARWTLHHLRWRPALSP